MPYSELSVVHVTHIRQETLTGLLSPNADLDVWVVTPLSQDSGRPPHSYCVTRNTLWGSRSAQVEALGNQAPVDRVTATNFLIPLRINLLSGQRGELNALSSQAFFACYFSDDVATSMYERKPRR